MCAEIRKILQEATERGDVGIEDAMVDERGVNGRVEVVTASVDLSKLAEFICRELGEGRDD